MRRWGWSCVCLLAGAAWAQEPEPAAPPTDEPAVAEPAADPALDALWRDWDAQSTKLDDLTMPFTQERRLALRPNRANVSRGTFQMRRDGETGRRSIRWHFTEPRERIEVLRGSEVRSYEPYLPKDRQVVEVRDLRAFGLDAGALDVLGQSAAQLRAAYTITRLPPVAEPADPAGSVRLRLVPRDATIRKRVAEIELLVDRARALPHAVILRGPVLRGRDGTERRSTTRYQFDLAAAKRNTGLAASVFELAPDGVPIKRR